MKTKKLISIIMALILIAPTSASVFAADSDLQQSLDFLNEHKDMLDFYHSMRFEAVSEKLSSSDISDEERKQLTEYIISLKEALDDCLQDEHSYLIAYEDFAGPPDCTSLGVCEYCGHSEIVLTGNGYRERHRDNDENGICDDCKREMPYLGCDHFCHSENIIVKKIVLPIFRFLWNLLGIEEYCDCGTYHFGI